MTHSIITKRAIAKAFKNMLETQEFEKISVTDIMETAHIRRQTFYNYFLDKYHLLEWIFKTDLQEQIIDNLNYISGIGLLHELLYFFEQNQMFYRKLFSIQTQNDFTSYFQTYCLQLMVKILVEYKAKHPLNLSEVEQEFFINYHAAALTQLIKTHLSLETSDFFLLGQHTETLLLGFLDYYSKEIL